MAKYLSFNLDPDTADAYGDISDILRDTIKRFDSLNKTVLKTERQLLKFDEINRLVAYEVKEKTAAAAKSTGGSKSSSSKSSTSSKSSGSSKSSSSSKSSGSSSSSKKTSQPATGSVKKNEASVPFYFTIKDILFNWDDLNWEDIMMKLLAGFTALGGAYIGWMVGGVPGAIIGLAAGLLFGIALDDAVFNFDGKLSTDEIWKGLLLALAPIAGGIIGFMALGPAGAVLGVTLGMVFSFVAAGIEWNNVLETLDEFFADLIDNFSVRWANFKQLVSEKFANVKNWFKNLSFGQFDFKLPHIGVEWQELAEDSILAKFLGINAIPHLYVEWYAKGGIVDGPTLIGAGEQGKEAIIPLERNTGWIHMVAVQLKEELEKLAPNNALSIEPLLRRGASPFGAAASGALVPPAAAASPPDLSSLAETIAGAIASIGQAEGQEPVIKVYLDGKQLTSVVTEYQRRNSRAYG